MDTLNYRFIGLSTDGLLIFEDTDYPSDAPQCHVSDEALRRCRGLDPLIGGKYFAVTVRHAEVRGFLHLTLRDQPKEPARR